MGLRDFFRRWRKARTERQQSERDLMHCRAGACGCHRDETYQHLCRICISARTDKYTD